MLFNWYLKEFYIRLLDSFWEHSSHANHEHISTKNNIKMRVAEAIEIENRKITAIHSVISQLLQYKN